MKAGIITGFSRSGTSALSKLLHGLPGVISTHELGVFHSCSRREGCESTKRILLDPKSCANRRMVTEVDWSKQEDWSTRAIIDAVSPHGRIFIDKMPNYLETIEKIEPLDFVICCLRDPREVIDSQIRGYKTLEDKLTHRSWIRPSVLEALTVHPTWFDYMVLWTNWKESTKIPWIEIRYDAPQEALPALVETLEVSPGDLIAAFSEWNPAYSFVDATIVPVDLPHEWLKMMWSLDLLKIPGPKLRKKQGG